MAEERSENLADAPQAASLGIQRDRKTVAEIGQAHELLMRPIAGAATASRLGIPKGSVFEARHVITPLDGSTPIVRCLSPSEAAEVFVALGYEDPPQNRFARFMWRLRRRDFKTPHIIPSD